MLECKTAVKTVACVADSKRGGGGGKGEKRLPSLPNPPPFFPSFVSTSQTALSLFTYTYMKFLSFLTQRLSFLSINVVKVQVSSILKEKNFRRMSRNRSRSAKFVVSRPDH